MPRAKTLTVTRPSPSTTAYAVSNASTPRSTLGLLLHRLSFVARVFLAVLCVLVVIGRWRSAISALSTTGTHLVASMNAGLIDAGEKHGIMQMLESIMRLWVGEGSSLHMVLSQRFGRMAAVWVPILAAIAIIWLLSRRGYVGTCFRIP